jgi:hypothetical protein
VERFRVKPSGPFSLVEANRYFGGWPSLSADPSAIVMAFPVEGWLRREGGPEFKRPGRRR